MAVLGKPQGIFDINDSDRSVGSYLIKSDVCEILGISEADIGVLSFSKSDGLEVIDERTVQRALYRGEIPNAPPVGNSSFDEFLLITVIKKAFPECQIERQVKIKRFKMDLKLTLGSTSIFVEFDGPSHFAASRFGPPKHEPFRKKKIIEDETGIEVVNWAYWIQRCSSNVKALFDRSVKGYGVLWSTNIHFGDFYFDHSAQIITAINSRFHTTDDGVGYFYGPNTKDRNNPEHPIINKIMQGHETVLRLLPKGYLDKDKWLPNKLRTIKLKGS